MIESQDSWFGQRESSVSKG